MTRRLLFLLPALVFAVIAGYFLWGLTDPGRNPSEVPSARVGKPVPAFDLPSVEGLETPGLASADLAVGEVTLLNFFASWCVPCRAEHPILMRLAETKRVRLVGINYRDAPTAAVDWLAELGNPYARIGADRDARAGIDWGVSGVPETFVVDRAGQVRYQHIGPILEQDLEEIILPIIEGLEG